MSIANEVYLWTDENGRMHARLTTNATLRAVIAKIVDHGDVAEPTVVKHILADRAVGGNGFHLVWDGEVTAASIRVALCAL